MMKRLPGFCIYDRILKWEIKKRHPIGCLFGASDEARTRYLHLGKVALYQMSYTRVNKRYYNRKNKTVKYKMKKVSRNFEGEPQRKKRKAGTRKSAGTIGFC